MHSFSNQHNEPFTFLVNRSICPPCAKAVEITSNYAFLVLLPSNLVVEHLSNCSFFAIILVIQFKKKKESIFLSILPDLGWRHGNRKEWAFLRMFGDGERRNRFELVLMDLCRAWMLNMPPGCLLMRKPAVWSIIKPFTDTLCGYFATAWCWLCIIYIC